MRRKTSSRQNTASADRESSNGRAQDARAVFDSIRRIVRVLRLTSRHTEKEFGLSAAQLFVLQKLAEAGTPLTPSDLAARTLTDQSSISVVTQRLVDRGYASRSRSETDARSYQLTLTETGRSVVRKVPDATQGRLLEAMLAMPSADVRQLAKLLGRLVQETGLGDEQASMLMEDEAPAAGPKRGTGRAQTR
jgi:DNA-binding MarR family transcriptional regulator